MPSTRDARPISTIASTIDPCDHCAIIREKPLPMPLVTIALFMMPMATSRMPVMIEERTPTSSASAIFDGPMETGLKNSPLVSLASRLVHQETMIRAAIAQEAA